MCSKSMSSSPEKPKPASEGKTETAVADAEPKKKKRKNWMPLESNPELMNKFLHKLGVSPMFRFVEVLGVDPDLLAMVPSPVFAVLLCFPISAASEKHRAEEADRIAKDGQADSKNVYFTLQTVGNACGTVGLIHSVLNNADVLGLDENAFFAKFLKKTKNMNPSERAAALEEDESIEEEHEALARDSEAKSRPEHETNKNMRNRFVSALFAQEGLGVDFCSFVVVDQILWELDGRKKSAIAHGKSSPQTLLYDAVAVIQKLMAIDPTEVRFNIVALTAAFDD